ncbi:MAG: hypothetical protein EPO57_01080, partial [Chitinophagaceae bacterium]
MKKKYSLLVITFLNFYCAQAQLIWSNVDSLYQPLPSSVQVFKSTTPLDGKPNIAYYVKINLNDKHLLVDVDTTFQRRLTPSQFYQKNKQPLVAVNCSFFSFQTHQNLSAVIKAKKPVAFNGNSQAGKGKDTLLFWHYLGSVIGFSKQKKMDIAWLYSDSAQKKTLTTQVPFQPVKDSIANYSIDFFPKKLFNVWPMETAV